MIVRQRRNTKLLILGILGFVTLAFFTNKFSPNSLSIIIMSFTIFFISSLLISQYLLNNVRRTILISLGLSIWLSLRAAGLREPIYSILLLASLISLEILFTKR